MNSVKIELLIEIDRQSKLLTSDIQEVDDREKKLKDEYRRKIHDELLKVLDDDLCNSKKEEELRSIIVNSKNMFDRINVKASVTSSFNRYETDQVTSDISKDGDGHVYDDEVLTPKSKGKQKLLINVFLLAIIAAIALTVAVLGIFGVGFGMKSLYKMYYTSSKTNKKDLKSQFNIKSKFISTMGTNSQRALSGIKGSLRSLSMNRLSNRSKMSQIPKLLEAKSQN
ncbi:hypothetical protein BLOT_001602 [Blomia tropicalis]|nr:hypothetical protein BLOT_001602 [Blomia tropicalis]